MFLHFPTSLTSVLGLSGMDLILFVVALVMLHFGFVSKIVLIIPPCLDHFLDSSVSPSPLLFSANMLRSD